MKVLANQELKQSDRKTLVRPPAFLIRSLPLWNRMAPVALEQSLKGVEADVRDALRQMRKSPGFAAVVVLVLALVGANASAFRVLNAVLLRPLEFANADRLVQITSVEIGKPVGIAAISSTIAVPASKTVTKSMSNAVLA
jgi:hypothetical protein